MKWSVLPGLILLFVIGNIARLVATFIPGVNYLIVTIFLGLVVGNTVGVPTWASSGVSTHKLWLEMGIVVMGATVAIDRIVSAGPMIVLLVCATSMLTIILIELLARFVFSIHEKTGSLLAAGSGICGVSAVVAIAESIAADDTHIAYAAATILFFDAATLFLYPVLGHSLGLTSTVYGIWAGLTMFSTGPVTAAGFAFSESAGQWALIVKLTRNSLIGIAAIVYAMYYAPRTNYQNKTNIDIVNAGNRKWRFLWDTFPKFIIGFLVIVFISNIGLLSGKQVTYLSNASDWAFLLAFAGLGLEIQLEKFRTAGYKPILTVFVGLIVISTMVLIIVKALF